MLKHVAYHEITHALKGHIAVRVSLLNAINACTKIEINNIDQRPAYVKLILAQEISADTWFALKKPEIAQCAILNSCTYLGSYNVLAMANTNWKALDLIEKR